LALLMEAEWGFPSCVSFSDQFWMDFAQGNHWKIIGIYWKINNHHNISKGLRNFSEEAILEATCIQFASQNLKTSSWRLVGPSWKPLGPSWGPSGASWRLPGSPLGRLLAIPAPGEGSQTRARLWKVASQTLASTGKCALRPLRDLEAHSPVPVSWYIYIYIYSLVEISPPDKLLDRRLPALRSEGLIFNFWRSSMHELIWSSLF